MAEFIDTKNQEAQRASDELTADGMEAFGRPVPSYRKDAALKHCRDMGLEDTNKAMGMINRAVDAIERDQPYQAMEAITAYLDLTGAYRLLAVLCTTQEPAKPEYRACGGCGETNPSNRCLGCLHSFFDGDWPEKYAEKAQPAPARPQRRVYDEWGF